MNIKKITLAIVALIIAFTACKKTNLADNNINGEALNNFNLQLPSNFTELPLNAATPSQLLNFSWTIAKPGVSIIPTYKWVAALKNGSIDEPLLEIVSNNNGKDPKLSISFLQLDAALGGKGVAPGAVVDLIWSAVAENGSVKLKSADVFSVKITRFAEGATPFVLLAPAYSTLSAPLTINPNSTSENITFRWTKSKPKTGGAVVTYKIILAERKFNAAGEELPINWSIPLFSFVSNLSGIDTFANISYKRISDSLTAKGFSSLPTPVNLKWTVVATSGTWNQFSDYINEMVIVREVKVYMVGSATPGSWDIAQSTRMIEDPRFPGTYFSYILLTGGNEFKFVNGQNWPPFAGAIDWGQDPAMPAGNITDVGESNIPITVTGVYRVTFDLSNKKFYLQTAVANGIGGMGMIGGFQGWSQPATKMNYVGVNKFILLANMNTNDEFKFHDGNDWNNSANNLNRWFAINPATSKMVVDPGSGNDNFKWAGANGRVRSIWNGSDVLNLNYDISSAAEMRIVGDGMTGVPAWNPALSPQMTYVGNGVWTKTLALDANKEIKFLAGNDWGAFDYEDNSGGSQTLGVPRKIQWEGGSNFKTPTVAGTNYTVTLDENNQTVTIN
ncbi:MAG: SusF/SusE family outer membrane protein [Ferruginibacter sp.]|nr:SusF/SusE family outer membrane protein [Ferruginibacter sp.]